ncbi:hypothetical protein ACFPRL_02840 [Pseudoclavibacter helvolus]
MVEGGAWWGTLGSYSPACPTRGLQPLWTTNPAGECPCWPLALKVTRPAAACPSGCRACP